MPKSASEPVVRPSLTRERIVLAAIEVIERDGEDALSMRAVAAELGVAVMSLYNHVPNKADLLDYPECINIVLTHSVEFPVGMRPAERALAVADAAGFDGATSVRIMRAMLAYALGAQMREIGAVKMLNDLPPDPSTLFAQLDPTQFPHVTALATELTEHDPETDFEFGLDLLISALDALPRRS
jgi:AcrR family transcriptional regulator